MDKSNPDGHTTRENVVDNKRTAPGNQVVVPPKKKKESAETPKQESDWAQT